MNSKDKKSKQNDSRKTRKEQLTDNATEAFPGFSVRLNMFIDLTDLEIPPLDNGRQSFLGNLVQTTRMSPGEWLKKDKPPKTATLRKLIVYLLDHIQGDYNPFKIEAWLKYGDVAVANPFYKEADSSQSLIPLATSLIVLVAKEIGVPANSFDLNPVLASTVETLSAFKITQANMVEPVHRSIVAEYIKANLR